MKLINKKIMKIFLLTSLMMLVISFNCVNAQISVVVSKSSDHSLTDAQIIAVFAGDVTTWDSGAKITIVDQPDSETGKAFYSKFLGESLSKLRVKWTKLVLSGEAVAPQKVNDDSGVKQKIADNPNAIGYISSSSVDGSVKVIYQTK